MDDCGFIDMLMDRLHGLEDKMAKLEKQVSGIAGHGRVVQPVANFTAFSDGYVLRPALGVGVGGHRMEIGGRLCELDDIHLSAVAFNDPVEIGVRIDGERCEGVIQLGEAGAGHHLTTVGDLLDALGQFLKNQPRECHMLRWEWKGIAKVGYDGLLGRTVYVSQIQTKPLCVM